MPRQATHTGGIDMNDIASRWVLATTVVGAGQFPNLGASRLTRVRTTRRRPRRRTDVAS